MNVRFSGGKADIGLTPRHCPLLTQSGHCSLDVRYEFWTFPLPRLSAPSALDQNEALRYE